MRLFGTFLAVGILALAAGCGGSSSGGFTSPTGRTASSGGLECKGQSCAAKDTYYSCVTSKCDADAKTCFGPSYASGTFSGACQSFITCTMSCPCDSTGATCLQTCYAAITADCVACLTTASTCGVTNSCGAQPPTCPSDASTAKNDSGTTTGTGCAAAQACCTALGTSLGASVAQTCQAAIVGLTDAQCTQAMAAYQTYCP
jgi:hypothetical protein